MLRQPLISKINEAIASWMTESRSSIEIRNFWKGQTDAIYKVLTTVLPVGSFGAINRCLTYSS